MAAPRVRALFAGCHDRGLELLLSESIALPARGDYQADGLGIDHVVRRVGQLDEHTMRTRRQALDDERFAARINPMPGTIIDGNV